MIETLTLGALQANCYIYHESSGHAMVVDAAAEPQRILEAIRRLGVMVSSIVSTHAHFDHTGALAEISSTTGAPAMIHEDDLLLLRGGGVLTENSDAPLPPGLPLWMVSTIEVPQNIHTVVDGEHLIVGEADFVVIHTPGHTPGGMCLYNAREGILFSGDTLFHMGVGRADLPGGHGRTLLASIKQRLFTLPDDTQVYPGHGQSTSIGLEKRRNPFVRANV